MLTAQNTNIVTAYETLGLTIEEIATEFDLEPVAVKATLMQFCPKYRIDLKDKESGDNDKLDFADTELKAANEAIVHLMRHSEDENLIFRAAKYVRDDKKGRLDMIKGIGKLNVNVALFNQHLIAATKAKELSRDSKMQDAATKQLKDAEVVEV